jgi:hypothetical protein
LLDARRRPERIEKKYGYRLGKDIYEMSEQKLNQHGISLYRAVKEVIRYTERVFRRDLEITSSKFINKKTNDQYRSRFSIELEKYLPIL